MQDNQKVVEPDPAGGWRVSGWHETFTTQQQAVMAARLQLRASGGGKVIVKGRDGRARPRGKGSQAQPSEARDIGQGPVAN
jgi:Uncharacterized protein conserved in bacteria (DUF2188)